MSYTFQPSPLSAAAFQAMQFNADLSLGAGTYDLCTATGGDVLIDLYNLSVYVEQAGGLITSVAIRTNQTNPTFILTAVEGALVNLTAQKNLLRAIPVIGGLTLKSGQKLVYIVVGILGSGRLNVSIPFMPLSWGATLTS